MAAINERDMLSAVRGGLRDIGYDGELIQEKYEFRDFLNNTWDAQSSLRRIELAAFAQFPPDYSNACFGVAIPHDETPQSIALYRALGAPQILALHPSQGYIRRWKMCASGDPEPRGGFPYGDIADTFRENEAQWGPQRILNARTLSVGQVADQLDFFDAGLLPALEASLRPKLENDIKRIMERCQDAYAEWHPSEDFNDVLAPLFRLVFRLIAAKMLIDRRFKPKWVELDAPGVIAEVDGFYFHNETPEPVLSDIAVQNAAWQQVRKGLDLQNISVSTLAHLYENAFVTEELRRYQSIYATPPEVADYVVRQLPIDKLAINERRVFEPFTGHAPFLTSAMRRLRELLPKDISPQDRHDYLVAMLSGIENEPFAREIARYALILADYPNPDGWRIAIGDAFSDPEFERLLSDANIVLCNPPYGDLDPEVRSVIGAESAHTKEAEVLRRIVATRPAMIGLVMPRTILSNTGLLRQLRLEIADRYKRISVTVLPDKVFNKASQEVALLVAHNIDLAGEPYSYSQVTSNGLDEFRRTGEPSWRIAYSNLNRQNNDVILWKSPMQSVWDAMAELPKFDNIAEIHSGVQYKTGLLPECVSNEALPDFVPGVQKIRGVHERQGVKTPRVYMESYLIADYQYLCTQPDVMRGKAYQRPWNSPKVIANRPLLSRGPWRIAGAVDDQGIWASQQYYGIWPRGDVPIQVLAALISGPVANAYLHDYPSKRDNQPGWLSLVPIPRFTAYQIELIVSLVNNYYSLRGQWIVDNSIAGPFSAKCLDLIYQIDAAVLDAYALPHELERELLHQFDGAERRPLPFHFPGYGEEYERAKERLKAEEQYRVVLRRYHELVDKTFLNGITGCESEEKERLRKQIDAYNAPFYDRIFADMDAQERLHKE